MYTYEQDNWKQIGAGGSSSGCRAVASCRYKEHRRGSNARRFGVVRQAMEENRAAGRARCVAKRAAAGTHAVAVRKAEKNAGANPLARSKGCRIFVRSLDRKTSRRSYPAEISHRISSAPCFENPPSVGFQPAKTAASRTATGSRCFGTLAHRRVAANKKGAARWRQPIIFLDESGFMLQPTVRRTWHRRGKRLCLSSRSDAIVFRRSGPFRSRPSGIGWISFFNCTMRMSTRHC